MDTMYKPTEIAKILNVSPGTIRRWIHSKRIGHFKLSERGYRISQEHLDRFLASRITSEEIDQEQGDGQD